MPHVFKSIYLLLIILFLASCGNEKNIEVQKKQNKIIKSEQCKLEEDNEPINSYISEKWISDNENCLSMAIKMEIEKKLYSFVKKIPGSEFLENAKYYRLLTILNPGNDVYHKKVKIYEEKINNQTGFSIGPYSITIPSDSNAKYFVLERGGKGDFRTITTKRVGSSGVSFSKRIYSCDKRTVKYLGTGQTMSQMKNSYPDPKMSSIVVGSIAYYLRDHACNNYN